MTNVLNRSDLNTMQIARGQKIVLPTVVAIRLARGQKLA